MEDDFWSELFVQRPRREEPPTDCRSGQEDTHAHLRLILIAVFNFDKICSFLVIVLLFILHFCLFPPFFKKKKLYWEFISTQNVLSIGPEFACFFFLFCCCCFAQFDCIFFGIKVSQLYKNHVVGLFFWAYAIK